MNHKIYLDNNGSQVPTLRDILPATGHLTMLLVGETPPDVSIDAGHYFQGRQGQFLWRRLKEVGLLSVPDGDYEDDHLISYGYGITNVVPFTNPPGYEPSRPDYDRNLPCFFRLLHNHQPAILFFAYKRILDKILTFKFSQPKADYGFYPDPKHLFPCKVFVFGMMGTPCDAETSARTLAELATEMRRLHADQS